ncbi:hypothetical protein GCM10023208_20740 [Erythrobacter westpacificensis]|uniref:TonB-dependent receptor-like beta-barrel domain-containing protein n=1 Tax=Erythrobacter westpacificensis TaxID=1055231 RepID=A0ABP9KGK9_9SPHN
MADIGLTDNLAMRVSGMGRSRDGYVDIVDYSLTHPNSNVPSNNARGAQTSYETMGGQSVVAGRVALEWEPNDRLNVYVAGDFNREDSDAIPTVLLAAGAPVGNAANFDPTSSNPATDANGNAWLPGVNGQPVPVDCRFVPAGQYSCDSANLSSLGYDPRYVSYSNFADTKVPTGQAPYKPYFALPITEFEGWGVMSNVTYDFTDALQLVAIGSYRTYTSRWGQDQDATPVPVAQLDNQLDHEAWSAEVRLNFEFADELVQGTVGGFYLDQDGEYTARVDLNYAGIDFIHGPDTTPSTTEAVFGTLTITPSEVFSITGGIRYTKDEKLYTYFRSNPDGTVPFVDNGSLLGPELEVAPAPCNQLRSFDPEEITTYEIGFKVDALDRALRLNGAAFYNDYKNIILTLPACPSVPCLQPRNVGEAEVKGFELEVTAYPADGFSLDGALSYIDFNYDDASVAPAGLTGDEITPYTPEWTWSFGAQYDHELQNGAQISARFDGSYQSTIYTDVFNTVWSEIEGYFVGGARVAFTDPRDQWTLALRVDNIFDEYYFNSVSDVTTSLGVVTGVPGLPRTWSLSVERRF